LDLTLGGLSAALIAAAGYVHNDIVDLPVDRISHPRRVLPSAEIPVRVAWILAGSCCLAGFAISLLLPSQCVLISALAILFLAVYNLGLKRLPLFGNLVVAIIGGIPFVFGGFAVGSPSRAALPAAFATVFHLGREILKDIQDQPGDRIIGSQALPFLIGTTASKTVATILLTLLIIGIPLPTFWGLTGVVYLGIGLGLNGLILLAICQIWGSRSPGELERPSRALKLGMIVGIVAFFVDSLAR
jgi:geranylgeranylglycerol-phosphate geranylgeranyltransferase